MDIISKYLYPNGRQDGPAEAILISLMVVTVPALHNHSVSHPLYSETVKPLQLSGIFTGLLFSY